MAVNIFWPKKTYRRPAKDTGPDVAICCGARGRPATLKHQDRYLHMLVKGSTGTGKTSRVLLPMIAQDIDYIAAGHKAGLTVIEPKGDLLADVVDLCRQKGIPFLLIDPMAARPLHLNPLEGDPLVAAEITRTVLKVLFGPQEQFFAQLQETVLRNTILLLKELRGDDLTLLDLAYVLRDRESLAGLARELEQKEPGNDLSSYFFAEILGKMEDKMYQFLAGIRQQLEDLIQCPPLKKVFMGRSEVNLDKHLAGGGVLLVHTALGPLGHLGDVFGRFALLEFTYAVFRRPGPVEERIPHFLYVDELPRFLNRELERLLALGRSYRVGCIFTIQSVDQLSLAEGEAFKRAVLDLLATKVVFGRMSGAEAFFWEQEFGHRAITSEARTFMRTGWLLPGWTEQSLRREEVQRPRFSASQLQLLPSGRLVYRIVCENSLQPPEEGRVLPPVMVFSVPEEQFDQGHEKTRSAWEEDDFWGNQP